MTFSFKKIDVSCASERHPGKHLAKKTDEQDLGFPLFVSLHFRSCPDSSPGPPQISRLSPSNSFYGRATRYSVTDYFWDPRDPSPMSHFCSDLHDPTTRKHLAPAPLPPPYCKQHAKKSGHHAARPGDPAAPVFSIAFGRWTSTAVKRTTQQPCKLPASPSFMEPSPCACCAFQSASLLVRLHSRPRGPGRYLLSCGRREGGGAREEWGEGGRFLTRAFLETSGSTKPCREQRTPSAAVRTART